MGYTSFTTAWSSFTAIGTVLPVSGLVKGEYPLNEVAAISCMEGFDVECLAVKNER